MMYLLRVKTQKLTEIACAHFSNYFYDVMLLMNFPLGIGFTSQKKTAVLQKTSTSKAREQYFFHTANWTSSLLILGELLFLAGEPAI